MTELPAVAVPITAEHQLDIDWRDGKTPDERVLRALFGRTRCTVCDERPARFDLVMRTGDGLRWNGVTICTDEGPCAVAAFEQLDPGDSEPWEPRVPVPDHIRELLQPSKEHDR